jgi:RHS repeat-associated protein
MLRRVHALYVALLVALFFLLGFATASALAQPAGATATYFHNDISGSPMLATDAAGNVVWKESYRPYGQKLRDEPASRDGKNKIGFAGSPFDASTGLSYMGARYYDPVIGRFMGVDPVGFQENNVHSFNRYAYANNNPYKFIDPDGRIAILAAVPAAISALTPVAYAIGTRIAMSSVYRFGMSMAAGEVGLVAPAGVTVGAGVAAKSADGVKQALQKVNLPARIEASGMKNAEAGKYFGWGPAGRMDKSLDAFSRKSLESDGWTSDNIANVAAGYREVAKITPGNPSALPRAEQLESLLNHFK